MLQCCFQQGKTFEAVVIAGTVPNAGRSAGAGSTQPPVTLAVAALTASMTLAASAAKAGARFHPHRRIAAAGRWLGCHHR